MSAASRLQTCFRQLSSVCKRFAEVAKHHTLLCSSLCLHQNYNNFIENHILSLLSWIQNHGSLVQSVTADCSSTEVEFVLQALYASKACLSYVGFDYVTKKTLAMLASFESVTLCVLCRPAVEVLSLHALQSMPTLTKLHLQHGSYSGLNLFQRLAQLELVSSVVTCSGESQFAKTLSLLSMTNSCIKGFHSRGIAECTGLQYLCCSNSTISATHSTSALDFAFASDAPVHVPASVSACTAVKTLRLESGRLEFAELQPFDAEWLASWANIEDLQLRLHTGISFSRAFGILSNLPKLVVVGVSGEVRFRFGWRGLLSLRELTISGRATFDSPLTDIALLDSLEFVSISDSVCLKGQTALQVQKLVNKLRADRPDVTLSVPGWCCSGVFC